MLKKVSLFAAAAVAVAALSMTNPARTWARAEGTWLWNTFILTSTQTMLVQGTATFTGAESHTGVITNAGGELGPTTATQTIAAGGTIAADACGGIKRITSASDVTTDTTNSIAAPAAANTGCELQIVNVGAHQILLDYNTAFPTNTGAASMRLDAGGSVKVISDGTNWWHGAWTEF